MEIRFTQPEVDLMRSYLDRVASSESQESLPDLPPENPEWNRIFLLLRKLLAYGVYYIVQANDELSYQELQKKTQKPGAMWVHVRTHLDVFEKLLAMYAAQHYGR
jgi:multisubunit Na+/H+ antiporter MnhE subunit